MAAAGIEPANIAPICYSDTQKTSEREYFTITHTGQTYKWTSKDRCSYLFSIIPFAIAFTGTAYILAISSIYLTVVFLILYLLGNIFQAGACVGCPYQGKFCPAVFGVYLSNLLSSLIYKNRHFEQRFYNINASLASVICIAALVFPVYWLYVSGWYFLVVYFILLMLHLYLFFPKLCPKCSYNDTCPGGRTVKKLLGLQ